MIPAPKVAVVTSRLRRLVAPDEAWVVGLRAVLRKIATDAAKLVIGDRTAGSDFVRHLAARSQIPFELLTPSLDSLEGESNPPLRDRTVLTAAETVYVLGLRSEGNLHRLLREYLQQRRGSVVLVDLPGLQSAQSRCELCEMGAQIWLPTANDRQPLANRSQAVICPADDAASHLEKVYLIVPFPKLDGWDLLTHTTRSCPGPWPDETFETYADSLFESRLEADHSPLGALRRIISQRRLIASGQTIRGGHGIVSFTACPLISLPRLHRFRPHRVRWDFEPYGICVRREWLVNRGTRPAIYGDNITWQSLPEIDRPFFQLAIGESQIDWSIEREWRHLGDLDLTTLTADDALLFVPDFEAAKSLAQISPWPITLWPGGELPVEIP